MIPLLLRVLARVPLPLLRAAAGVLGDAWYHLVRVRRRVALDNLARSAVDPGARHRGAVVRRAGRHLVLGVLELPRWLRASDEAFFRHVAIEGRDHLGEAVARGHGAVVVTAHLGAWELLGPLGRRLGHPVALVVRRPAGRWSRRLVDALRRRGGVEIIEEGPGALRAMRAALARGTLVGFAADQRPPHGQRAVPAAFLGRPARIQRTPAVLAARASVPLLVAVTHRHGDGHRVRIGPPLHPDALRGPLRQRVDTLSSRYAVELERAIAAHPDQWLWHHRRWIAPPAVPAEEIPGGALPVLDAGRSG